MASEKRLIDANDAVKVVTDIYWGTAGYRARERLWQAVEAVKEIPTVDAVEVVHGHWEEHTNASVQCSACGGVVLMRFKFCPNCGARMDGDSQ